MNAYDDPSRSSRGPEKRRSSGAPRFAREPKGHLALSIERADLTVPDVPLAARWYERTFGLRPLDARDRTADPERVLVLTGDGRHPVLGLRRDTGDDHAGTLRVVLRVPGRLLPRVMHRLETDAHPRPDEEGTIDASDLLDLGSAFLLRLRDPWGHQLELRCTEYGLVRAWLEGQAIAPAAPEPHRHEINLEPQAMLDPPHPATLEDELLLAQCRVTFGRSSGPGGQHRNRVETAAELTHEPTGIQGWASERRKQAENRSVALRRLRTKLALKVRCRVDPARYEPSELWRTRRQGERIAINPGHRDYPALLAEALDVINARRWDVAGAAGVLGITMSQLARLLRHERQAFVLVNEGRTRQGLPALK